MKRRPFFITGTDTGAGKTVVTALLARFLRGRSRVAAFKPVCSGGRADARLLAAALGGDLTLDEINPWHFRAALAPVLAARREKQEVRLREIVKYVGSFASRYDWVLVEGAGGLLSPLGEDVDSRDLILGLQARPIIVSPNRLGVVNLLRLTLAGLPAAARVRAAVVLVSPEKSDAATGSNAALLAEFFDAQRIVRLPWLGRPIDWEAAVKNARVRRALGQMVGQDIP